jgi:hypothetical protein
MSEGIGSMGVSDPIVAATELLSPERYDREESRGLATLPNRVIEASSTAHFQFMAYPTRVPSLDAVWRYAEVMHEGRLPHTFADLLGDGVTQEEMALMRTIVRAVVALSGRHYRKVVVPKDALVRALNVYRHIRYLYPNGGATIVEIGPGSGYLGALLVLSGFSYVAVDIAQGFYVFQNHLFNAIAPGRVVELVEDDRAVSDFSTLERGQVLHVPWWKWMMPEPAFSLGADIVTANHCLCEMHGRALLYNVKTSSGILANGGQDGLFLFEGWGSDALNPVWSVAKAFADNGYSLAEYSRLVTVFTRAEGPHAGLRFPLLPQRPPPPAPEPPPKFKLFKRMPAPGPVLPVELPPLRNEEAYYPPLRSDPAHPITARMMEGRARLGRENSLTLRDFESMLTEEARGTSIQSGDEAFLNYIDVAF